MYSTYSTYYTLSSDDLIDFYTIFYDVYVLMFWRRVLPSSSCQLNFFWVDGEVSGKGDHVNCSVFWPFRALEKEEGIDLISNSMGIECCEHLEHGFVSQKTHYY